MYSICVFTHLWIYGEGLVRLAHTQQVIDDLFHGKVKPFLHKGNKTPQDVTYKIQTQIAYTQSREKAHWDIIRAETEPIIYSEWTFTWAINWMILTKMLRGVSLGTTLREPFGKSAVTILRSRLWRKKEIMWNITCRQARAVSLK